MENDVMALCASVTFLLGTFGYFFGMFSDRYWLAIVSYPAIIIGGALSLIWFISG